MRLHNERGDAELTASVIVLVVCLVGWAIIASASCSSRWARSGMPTSWGPVQGCLVKLPDGRWLPDERIREVDIAPR